MRKLFSHFSDLVILLAVVVLLFTIGRAFFYFNFRHSFDGFDNAQVLKAFLSGFEFDLKVVLMVNSIFILLFFIPFKLYNTVFYLSILKFIYFTSNSAALLFNLLDVNSFAHSGMRMSIVNFKVEILRMYHELIVFDILLKSNIVILICFIIFLIILWNLLDLVQKRDFEDKPIKRNYVIFSFILLCLYGWFSYGFITDKGEWLAQLYKDADRKIAPLVMNNPYLFLSSAKNWDSEENEYWDFVEFQSERKYNALKSSPIHHICILFIDSNDSLAHKYSPDLNALNNQTKAFEFNVLQSGCQSIDRYLDETLLSIPSILPVDFYQSVYSLNNFESLPQILEKNLFITNLFSIGYDKKQIRIIKNFHGFKNYIMLDSIEDDESKVNSIIFKDFDSNGSKKTLDVILIQNAAKNVSESILDAYLKAIKNDGLAFVYYIPKPNHEQKALLIESMKLYMPDNLTFYKPVEEVIAQCLDIKPTILHYLNQRTAFIAYGSSLFANEEKLIFTTNGLNSYSLLKDSLLLNYSNNETKSIQLLKNKQFLKEDFKDSLAVEKIDLENKIHSIFQNFEYRVEGNKMK